MAGIWKRGKYWRVEIRRIGYPIVRHAVQALLIAQTMRALRRSYVLTSGHAAAPMRRYVMDRGPIS